MNNIEEIKNELLSFLTDEIDINEIESIESNCGSCYIQLNDGKTYSLFLMECEND